MRKNNKGSLRDILLIVFFGMGMILAGLFALKVMSVMNTQLQAQDEVPTQAKAVLTTVNNRLPKWIDGAFLLFWVVFMIVGIFLAFQIQSNPVFLPVSIFFFIFMIFISKMFSTVYTNLATSSILSTEASTLSIIPYVVPRLPIFSFVFGAIIITVMVIKR